MQPSRIDSLDYLRGVAIFGMLIANVPWHAGSSMSRIHEVDAASVSAWLLQYAVIDQRFMPIFAMLFGAGLLLLAEGRSGAPGFKRYFVRRMGILFLIGLAHAYLIWPGDILLTYAICGPILLLFLRAGPVSLILAGIAFKVIHIVFLQWPALYQALIGDWLFNSWLVIGEAPMSEIEAYAGSYGDLFAYNAWRNVFIQWTAMPFYRIWNALSFMLTGMAFFRLGLLQANGALQTYRRMLWGGLALGLPALGYGLLARIGASETVGPYLGWTVAWPYQTAAHLSGTALTALSVLAGLILWFKSNPNAVWLAPFQAVGRLALTNYVMHSVIFLVIFWGFKWVAYDSLDPDERLLWAVAIFTFQVGFSMLWLSWAGQGPLERLWRKLAGAGPARSLQEA
ncbi:DUF418 domain-containing protein [Maricaulis sp.]|uniref:DUF418 domain-containing protein n=1 Tax=Maricaulis sp. TaxID=1486257 RepID=UPI0026022066|nr:DUF418 domain-containing protein [Maricaulis sp.]